VRRRAGGHLDPALCAAFAEHADAIFAALESDDLLASALGAEPPPLGWTACASRSPRSPTSRACICSGTAVFAIQNGLVPALGSD
jgi:hypothetical protein